MTTVTCDSPGCITGSCTRTLDLWMNPLLSRLSGATDAQVRCELRAALREFYYQSRAWREQIGPYQVYQNRDLIWLNPVDAYSNVAFVRCVWIEDPAEGRKDLKPLQSRVTDGRVDYPTHYQAADPAVLRLWPKPDADLGAVLWADVTLIPSLDTTRVPEAAHSHHYETVLEGALSRLYMMANKPWTNPDSAFAYGRSFRRRCIEFRSISDSGYLNADRGWQFPPFA